ncbi:MAG: DUF6116 family protein [Thermoanaerobaculia bacterium]
MAASERAAVRGLVGRFARRLRFPQLFAFVLVLFLVDLVVPDMVPFLDEILFGLLTVLLGSLRRNDDEDADPARVEKDVTPGRR